MTRTHMPTYSYRRADGSTFDIEQRITEPALSVCPTTGQPVVRVITGGAGLVFKGSGFYLTDYARRKDGGNAGAATKKPADAAPSDSPAPAAKPAADAASGS